MRVKIVLSIVLASLLLVTPVGAQGIPSSPQSTDIFTSISENFNSMVAALGDVVNRITSGFSDSSSRTPSYNNVGQTSPSQTVPSIAPLAAQEPEVVLRDEASMAQFLQPSIQAIATGNSVNSNLIRNNSFEVDTNGKPRMWNYQHNSATDNTLRSIESIRSGVYGLKFKGGSAGTLGISQPDTKTVPGRPYTLSMYIKPVNTSAGTFKFGFWDEYSNKYGTMKTVSFNGTKEWTRVSMNVTTPGIITDNKNWFPMIEVTGLTAGNFYVDDVLLEEGTSLSPYNSASAKSGTSATELGGGSILFTVDGDLYPALTGQGSLGFDGNRFYNAWLSNDANVTRNVNAGGDVVVNGGDIGSDENLTLSATGYVRIGDSGTPTPSLATGDDALFVEGNLEADGNFTIAGTSEFTGNVTMAGDLAVNGGDLTSTATTFNLLNATVTTLNIGGAGTTIAVGSGTGTTTLSNNLTVNMVDNNTNALDIQQGTNNYINVNTTDAGENISLGNATTNPSFNFLGTGAVAIAGLEGSTELTLTAGDAAISDGSLAVTDDDNAASFTTTNNTATTIGVGAAGGVNVLGSTSLTTGDLLELQLTEGTLAGGAYIRAWDVTGGASVFSVAEDGVTTIAGAGDGTNALVLTTGDLRVTDGDVIVSGGDFDVTLDAGDGAGITNAASTIATGALAVANTTAAANVGNAIGQSAALTLTDYVDDGVADTRSGLDVTVTNNASDAGADDNIYGLAVNNLGGAAQADGNEYAIYQAGTTWDLGLKIEDAVDIDGSANISDTTAGADVAMGNATGNLTFLSDNADFTLTDATDNVFQLVNSANARTYLDVDAGAADTVTLGNATDVTAILGSATSSIGFGTAFTVAATTGLTTIAGSADGIDALVLTLGDILVTNGDLDLNGGDFNVVLDAADEANISAAAKSDASGVLVLANTLAAADTAGSKGLDVALTTTEYADDGAADTHVGLDVLVSSNTSDVGVDDIVYGMRVQNLGGLADGGNEYAIYQAGTTWDYGLYIEDAALIAGLADLNGGIAVDTDNFTVSGTTGNLTVLSSATAGTLASISLDAAAVTGATTGLAVDMSPVTTGDFNKIGIKVTADNGGTSTNLGIQVAGASDIGLEIGGATTDITTATDEALTVTAAGTGDVVISTDADTNLQVTAGAAPGVDMIAVSNAGQASTTDGVDALQLTFTGSNASGNVIDITPSFSDTAAVATNETFNIIDIDAFTATINAAGDTDTVIGLSVGNLTQTQTAGTITATGVNVGTGWDIGVNSGSGIAIGTQTALTADSVTPSVAGISHARTANTVGTLISNFTNGTAGQLLTIEINDANTDFDCTASNLNCGGTDITIPAAGDVFTFVFDGTNWNMVQWMDTSATQTGADVAEWMRSTQNLSAGTVVVAHPSDSGTVVRSEQEYDSRVIGVVSDVKATLSDIRPGLLLGDEEKGNTPVALTGRVMAKFDGRNGPALPGDALTSAPDGKLMKAVKAGPTVGKALGNDANGLVLILVNIGWFDPAEVSLAQLDAVSERIALLEALSKPAGEVLGAETTTAAGSQVAAAADVQETAAATEPELGVQETASSLLVENRLTATELSVTKLAVFSGDIKVTGLTELANLVVSGSAKVGTLEIGGAVVIAATAGEDLKAGDAVRVSSANEVKKADSTDASRALVLGLSTSDVKAGDAVKVAVGGKVGGFEKLAVGKAYFLGTNGKLATGAPETAVRLVQVGLAISQTDLVVQITTEAKAVEKAVEAVVAPVSTAVVAGTTSEPTPEPTVTPAAEVVVEPTPTVEPVVTPTPEPEIIVPTETPATTPTPTPAP